MAAKRAFRSALICAALRWRWSNGFRITYEFVMFGVFTPCSAFSPANAGTISTPSVPSAIFVICSVTSLVRASDAPSGSFAPANRYSLSCTGMKPPGTALSSSAVAASSTA